MVILTHRKAPMTRNPRLCLFGLCVIVLALLGAAAGQAPTPPSAQEYRQRILASSAKMEAGLAEPFKGITMNGTVVPRLFEIRSTRVSTAPVRDAAEKFLQALTPEHR